MACAFERTTTASAKSLLFLRLQSQASNKRERRRRWHHIVPSLLAYKVLWSAETTHPKLRYLVLSTHVILYSGGILTQRSSIRPLHQSTLQASFSLGNTIQEPSWGLFPFVFLLFSCSFPLGRELPPPFAHPPCHGVNRSLCPTSILVLLERQVQTSHHHHVVVVLLRLACTCTVTIPL